VEDNGRGFDTDHLASLAPDQRGLGLHEITERARMMRGHVIIHSWPGQGTRVTVEIPVPGRKSGP
jgi:signal transduction histidine kinase